MVDILISGGTVITMDKDRRIVENGAIAIENDIIVDVDHNKNLLDKYKPKKNIDARRKVVMPGLIDGHGHSGHGLVKTIGVHNEAEHSKACEKIYAEGSTENFWKVEGYLTALERIKFGTTCGVSYFGGGDMVMRTDDPIFGERHCEAIEQIGLREFFAVGPRRPPFPRKYIKWIGGTPIDNLVTFEDQRNCCETLIKKWHGKANGRINLCIMLPVSYPQKSYTQTELLDLKEKAQAFRELTKKYNILFTQDAHERGTIKFAHEKLDIIGKDSLLSHCTDISKEEIKICKYTDAKIVHNPSAWRSIKGRCPVPELLDAGVTVLLGSDGTAPDRSYDMFRHMFQFMHYQRTYYHDPMYVPHSKVLEMVTIDAAKGLGQENLFGSLEPGKKADIILVDIFKPHMYPFNMPIHRITSYANGNDVDTVIIDGKIVMENRIIKTVNEKEILEMAQSEMELMLDRTNLRGLLKKSVPFWGKFKY